MKKFHHLSIVSAICFWVVLFMTGCLSEEEKAVREVKKAAMENITENRFINEMEKCVEKRSEEEFRPYKVQNIERLGEVVMKDLKGYKGKSATCTFHVTMRKHVNSDKKDSRNGGRRNGNNRHHRRNGPVENDRVNEVYDPKITGGADVIIKGFITIDSQGKLEKFVPERYEFKNVNIDDTFSEKVEKGIEDVKEVLPGRKKWWQFWLR